MAGERRLPPSKNYAVALAEHRPGQREPSGYEIAIGIVAVVKCWGLDGQVEGWRGYIDIVEDILVYEQIMVNDRGKCGCRTLAFSQSSYGGPACRGVDILAKRVLSLWMHQIMDCSRIVTRGDHLSCVGEAEGG